MALQACLRGLQTGILNGQFVSLVDFDPFRDRYHVATTMGLRAIKPENVEILSQWRGKRILVRGVARSDLDENFVFAISDLDAEGKVVVAKVAEDDNKDRLFRVRNTKLRLLPHMPACSCSSSRMQHFYRMCHQDWGGSNPQQMYDLFGLPSEVAPSYNELTDFRRPPSEAEIRAYFGNRVYQGLEMAEFQFLAQHNFEKYSFGRQGGYSNNDHTYFLTDKVLRGMIYVAGRGAASHEKFSEMSQRVPVTSDTEHDGQWYPVIAVQIQETTSIVKITIKWRCPAIGAWCSRTWSSSSDRFVQIDSSRLSQWVAAAKSKL